MPQILEALTGPLIGEGMGLLMEKHNDKRQLEQQRKLQELQLQGQKEIGAFNYEQQMRLWHDTNYSAQMGEMKKAGINPALLYGGGGPGGTTAAAQAQGVGMGEAPRGGGETMAMGLQLANTVAQTENIKADTQLKQAQAVKTAGADTKNVEADTENKILQKVLTDYLGKEAADQYNLIKSPNRGIEEKTYEDELEARQGIAGNIYELWTEGKLHDKSAAEIENILLNNAKTRTERMAIMKDMEMLEQNIKGAKLDNIIKDIEVQMQKETGVDRNAPTWMKVIARLFGYLMPKTR